MQYISVIGTGPAHREEVIASQVGQAVRAASVDEDGRAFAAFTPLRR